MSNRDGFASGLITGAAIGGLIGGVIGVLFAKRTEERTVPELTETSFNGKQHHLEAEKIEIARLSLEDKIAQLNQAIDEVREQLNTVNRTIPEEVEEDDG